MTVETDDTTARAATAALRAEVDRRLDVEAALREFHDTPAAVVRLEGRRPTPGRRLWPMLAAAAAVIAAVTGVIVLTRGDDDRPFQLLPADPNATTEAPDTTTTAPAPDISGVTLVPVPFPQSTSPQPTSPQSASPQSTSPQSTSPQSTSPQSASPITPPSTVASVDGEESLGIGAGCVAEACPSLVVRADGVVVSLDPTTGTITIHESTPRSFTITELAGRNSFLVANGPDDVVYVTMQTATQSDPIGDILAIATSPVAAGTIVHRVDAVVDQSGDSDLVPTRAGLVSVGCCGMDTLRPDPFAVPVISWYDESGAAVTDDSAQVSVELRDDGSLDVIRDDGGVQRRWNVPSVGGIRGMPPVVATSDGGALVFVVDVLASPTEPSRLVRLDPEGTVGETQRPANTYVWLEPSGSVIVFDEAVGYTRLHPFAT